MGNNSTPNKEGEILREIIEKIMNTLDLSFSDIYEDENVRQLTLEGKTDLMEQAVDILTVEEAMNFSVFSSLGADNPTADIYVSDFPSDFRASMYLLLGGYYRQAILSLRNWLEIRLTGVYYAFAIQDNVQYEGWKSGTKEGPFGRSLIKGLFGRAEFQKADSRLELRKRLKDLYSELSAFTHGGGIEHYDLQARTDNVPRFNPQSVDLWFQFAVKVFAEIAICFFLAYGKDAFDIEGKELEILLRFLPESYRQELQSGGIIGAKQT